ncbi:MAG: GatB/YqeY domain-containing protein [Proteocatella sp.]|nr:GatB/YqeY domain-containing protein [Proteocatella sp.]MBP8654082.1 GatB/YqeY domain-containing protein [Proteocatella sp.]MBP9658220.1 GatB/YqeY domain-containing protein [Proteocatella sp.]NCB70561.1 GatB/YqeY domain-containing protein [Clostridia bacterium]
MTLKERLMEDMKVSMRNKETLKKSVITMIRASVKQKEVDDRVDVNDDDVIELIAKQLKQRKDALVEFEKAERDDLIAQTKAEIEILASYLPQQLTDEELEAVVRDAVAEVNAQSVKDMGKIMGKVMAVAKGRVDGKRINEMVKKVLN